jgi:hypothetical protein
MHALAACPTPSIVYVAAARHQNGRYSSEGGQLRLAVLFFREAMLVLRRVADTDLRRTP